MVFSGILGYLRSYGIICDIKYIPVLNNNYLEHNLDNHRVNFLYFQSTSMQVFHAAVTSKCCVTFI